MPAEFVSPGFDADDCTQKLLPYQYPIQLDDLRQAVESDTVGNGILASPETADPLQEYRLAATRIAAVRDSALGDAYRVSLVFTDIDSDNDGLISKPELFQDCIRTKGERTFNALYNNMDEVQSSESGASMTDLEKAASKRVEYKSMVPGSGIQQPVEE